MWQSPILPPERWTRSRRRSSSARDAAARQPSRRRLVSLMFTSSSTIRTSTNVSLLRRWMYVLRIGACRGGGATAPIAAASTSPSELSAAWSIPATTDDAAASTTSPCISLRRRFFSTSSVSSSTVLPSSWMYSIASEITVALSSWKRKTKSSSIDPWMNTRRDRTTEDDGS